MGLLNQNLICPKDAINTKMVKPWANAAWITALEFGVVARPEREPTKMNSMQPINSTDNLLQIKHNQ
jgi:hypothetical protein